MNVSKRAREGTEQVGSSMSWEELHEVMSFDRMKPVYDMLVYRDQFEIAYIKRLVEETKRFLILKTIKRDLDATLLCPSPKVDHALRVLLELQVLKYHFNILIF